MIIKGKGLRRNPCEFDMVEPTALLLALGEGTAITFHGDGYIVTHPSRKPGNGEHLITAVNNFMVKNGAIYDHPNHTYRFQDEEPFTE